MDEVDKIRHEISSVDERILEALANRHRLVENIIQAKEQLGTPIRDFLREEQLLADLIAKGRTTDSMPILSPGVSRNHR